MADLFAIVIKKKDYAERSMARGRSIAVMMEEAFRSVMPGAIRDIKNTYLTRQSDYSIQKRKGWIFNKTKYEMERTGAGNVSAKIMIGDGVAYTPLHVGKRETQTLTSAKGPFVIPFPHVRNKDGSWRAPYIPGQLRSVKGLYRGSKGKGENPAILYQRISKTQKKPMFLLKRQIRMPRRVSIDEIENDVRSRLSVALTRAFDGYDFGYIQMRKGK